jgi:shikimate kinase/3-dehydroquinate synthase
MSPGASDVRRNASRPPDPNVRCNGFSRPDPPNLVITGFMGAGKTAVGREVARCLGWPFVDMDAEIEARTGKSIPCLFAEEGEVAFRRLETALCHELAGQRGLVIATGGGTLVDPANRAAMMANGTVVCLAAELDEVLCRLRQGAPAERPLLEVPDPQAEARRLLEARRGAYAALPWQVDTTGRRLEQVAAEVVTLAGVHTRIVRHPAGTYPLHVGAGLLPQLGSALRAVIGDSASGSRVAVVSNPIIEPLYGEQVRVALAGAGFRPVACSVPDGEQHKTLATVAALYEQFLAGGLDRGDTVLSLGGGVIGDVAGFAAATFLRGVRFVQVPTTLLAMVDASVGGKTGVDLAQGKNLVGAFKQPALVLVDPAVLATLPPSERRSGMAEALKHAVISDPALFAQLERPPGDHALPLTVTQLACAIGVKIDIVEEDPYEAGRRAVLNLGHTIGHALERLSGYGQCHGEAVAIGLVGAVRMAVALGLAEAAVAERITSALAAWELPVRCPPFSAESIWAAMATDKKRRGSALRWVLPRGIGQVEIVEDVDREVVLEVLGGMGAR